MILLLHIIVALSSLFYSVYVFFQPSKTKLNIIYGSIVFTFITGLYLIFTKPAHLAQTCVTGLVYLGFMLVGIFAARHKLAVTINK